MTLSIDDLVKAYTKVYWAIPSMDGDSARIAGIRAVVTALRDENRHWIDADKMFDKILAPRGDEAAGDVEAAR